MAAIPDLTSSLAAALEAAGVPHMGFPDQHRIELPGEIDVELDVMLDTWAALDERGRRELIDELLAEWRRDRVTLFPEAFLRLALEAARGSSRRTPRSARG
jgi:hypothetical protein